MNKKIIPTKIERYEELMQTKTDSSDLSDKSMEKLLVCSDKGIMFFKEVESYDILEIDFIENVSILHFEDSDTYNEFIKTNPELEIIAYSEQHDEPCLVVQD